MKPIHLLVVITTLELGGAQKQALSIISGLDKKKFKVFLFTGKGGLLENKARSIPSVMLYQSRFLERVLNPVRDLLVFFELVSFIKKNSIDIVHTHSSKAGILGRVSARCAGVKKIFHTVHGWSFNDYQPALFRFGAVVLERCAARMTTKIIVVSEHDKRTGIAARIGKKSQYSRIRYGINDRQFSIKSSRFRRELRIDDDDVLVTSISCFKPQKGIQDFLALISLIKKRIEGTRIDGAVKFILVGDGVLRQAVEKRMNDLVLNDMIILTGWRNDIPDILASSDIFVLTSLWEGLPVTVLESKAAGLPVVATHTGGIAEVITHGVNGYLVPRHDMEAMAGLLYPLLLSRDARRKMGEQRGGYLKNIFSEETMIRSYDELFSLHNR